MEIKLTEFLKKHDFYQDFNRKAIFYFQNDFEKLSENNQSKKSSAVQIPYILTTLSLLNLSKNHNTKTGRTNPTIRQKKDRRDRIKNNNESALSI